MHHHLPPQLGRSAALHSLQINIWNSGAIAIRYSGRTTGYCDNGRTDSYCFLFRFVGEGNPPLRLCIVFNVDSCGRPPGVAPPGSHPHYDLTQPVLRGQTTANIPSGRFTPCGPLPLRHHHRASPPTTTARPIGCVAQPTNKHLEFRSNCF